MSKLLSFLLIIAIFTSASAFAWDLSGRLSHRGKPISGVSCRLFFNNEEQATASSDDNGRFNFKDIKTESIKLRFTKDGFFPAGRTIMNFSGANSSTTVQLKKRQQWTLLGEVKNQRNEAIDSALLTFKKTSGPRRNKEIIGTCFSNKNGQFSFSKLFDTACSFTVEASGYQGRFIWKRNAEQKDLEIEIKLLDTSRQRRRVSLYSK